jgi:two-component system, chemotaxis family, chemotaxis protein CheY
MKTILVVDDDDSIVEFLAQLLELEGYAVLTASNGQEALERASGTVPGLIVTDQMMPIMTGTELFRALKSSPRLRQVPVILITSAPPATARDLHWAGVFRKPLDLEAFLRSVHRVFRERCERSALG